MTDFEVHPPGTGAELERLRATVCLICNGTGVASRTPYIAPYIWMTIACTCPAGKAHAKPGETTDQNPVKSSEGTP